MLCSHSHILMTRNLKRTAVRYEKKGENANCLWMLYRGNMYLAYSTIANGTDHNDGKNEEDLHQ